MAINPDYPNALNVLAVGLANRRLDEAVPNLDKAIALKPDYTE